jgi:hypothetical protein
VFFDGVEPEVEIRFDLADPVSARSVVGAGCNIAIVEVAAFLESADDIFPPISY